MKRIALAALVAGAIASPALAQVPIQTGKLVSSDSAGGVAGVQMCPGAPSGNTRCTIVEARVNIGTLNVATGQVSAGTTATLIVPYRLGRSRVILNVLAANTCNFGPASVTTATGFQLQPTAGVSVTLQTGAAIYAACSAATAISYVEEY